MATEDHPLEYAEFEGVIPRGEYGGGTVMVWDRGTYEFLDGSFWQGKFHVLLTGKKLKGEWILVKGAERNGKNTAWYWIKAGSEMPRPAPGKEDSSALTARSMSQIAEAVDAVWHSNRNGAQNVAANRSADLNLETLPKARVQFIPPMLATAAELPLESAHWLYEIKLDGYRCLAAKKSRAVKLWSRRRNLLTRDFPSIARECAGLPANTLIDGEIAAIDDQGRPSFHLLQNHRSQASAVRYYPFDLLILRGHSLLGEELWRRRALLAEVVAPLGESIQLSESFEADPAELVRAAQELGLEGIVAKRKDSVYEAGKRSRAWVKHKINRSREFVVGGYTAGTPFDALIVGYYEGAELYFAAKVRNGFVPHSRRQVFQRLNAFVQSSCPFVNLPEKKRGPWALTAEEMKKCRWVRPVLVAAIEFNEWTPDGHLRHSSFAGLRDDKEAQRVVRRNSRG